MGLVALCTDIAKTRLDSIEATTMCFPPVHQFLPYIIYNVNSILVNQIKDEPRLLQVCATVPGPNVPSRNPDEESKE